VSSQPRIPRSERVAGTDKAIIDATITILNGAGYSTLTLNGIARLCKRSTTTVTKRFHTPSESAAVAWKAHYGAIAVRDLEGLLTHAGLLDGPANHDAFASGLEAFRLPNREWQTISELLLISAFEPPLQAAIQRDLRPAVQHWCTPTVDLTLATQRAYTLTLAIGLTLIGAEPNAQHGDLSRLYKQLLHALRHPSPPKATPHLSQNMPLEADTFDFHTQDPRERRLFAALLSVIAERGIDRATTQAIAQAANSNEGLLFNRYPSKIDAFHDAITQHQSILMQEQNAAVLALSAHTPPAIVDAAVIQRSLHPDREASRAVGMEYLRMARYHPRIASHLQATRNAIIDQIQAAQPDHPRQDIEGWVHYGLAIGAGLGVLPLLYGDATNLPFNVVLEPLLTPPAS
jgi:AcrR family transcriptional regulator